LHPVLLAAFAVAPLLPRRTAFRAYGLVLGVPVLLLALPLAYLGGILLIPAATLLLLSRGADPRRSPDRARFLTTIAATVLALTLAWYASVV
ncbi:hypothetical protein, partial [Streptomyces sp. WAC06614]|uniref:hypothetical protein n=1 Tax=Streptomyces sp. WAC06614 TaxID=2487416 RepID=UPI001C8DCE3B